MKTRIIIVLLALLVSAAGARTQPGSIGGLVYDAQNRQPLVGANVVIQGTGRGASTDKEGHFIIENLEPGSYNVEIYYLGYTTLKKGNVIVNPKRTTKLDLALYENYLEGEVVEVSAGYFEKPREAVVSSRSMDFEEIRRSPGDLVDIQRSVQALPAVVSGSDQSNEIITRGGYPGENLFLMDNIEIANPNHFAVQGAGGGPINMLNSYMVQKIDFYAGAFSARYGDKASSVMDISLRDGSFERYRGEGSLGLAGLGMLIEGPLGNRNSFIFSARKSYLDLINSSTGISAVPQYYSLQGKATFNFGTAHTVLWNTVFGADEIRFEDEDAAGAGRGAENADSEGSQWVNGLTWRALWFSNLYSLTTVSAVNSTFYVDVYEKYPWDDHDTFYTNDSRESEYTAKTELFYQPHKRLEINAGVSYKAVDFDYDIWLDRDTLSVYENGQFARDSLYFPVYSVNRKLTSSKRAAYLQLSFDPLSRLRLTAGIRYDYFQYNGFGSWSPRLGMSYRMGSRTTLNLAYGKQYQSPAYVNVTAHPENKKLTSKYTQQYIAGVEHLFRDDIKLVVEGYYKTYSDVPISQTLTNTDPFDFDNGRMVNAGSGRSRGIEFFLQKKITGSFSAIVSYARSWSEAKDPRYNTYYNWDYDYPNVFTAISGYKFKWAGRDWYQQLKHKWWFHTISWFPLAPADELELSVKFRYLGGRPYTEPDFYPRYREWIITGDQPLNGSRYPAYHRLDLRIDRRFIFDSWNLVVFFDINNIYNRDNLWTYQYGTDDAGNKEIRRVLQYKTLPVGGISVEF